MERILNAFMQASDRELRQIMAAIEQRCASIHQDWDVVYVAVHKDPALRKTELAQIVAYMEQDIVSSKENVLP